MSCNGCRVLRKGCSQDCVLRPCLEWIESAESQSNATLFLAKFYGRAGLINLINAASGTPHLYPEIFKSLLFEACGRIINPVEGALGLLSSNNWSRCQAAVDSVLDGKPLIIDSSDNYNNEINDLNRNSSSSLMFPLQRCDIRHLSTVAGSLHRIRNRNGFKKTGGAGRKPVSKFLAANCNNDHDEMMMGITNVKYNEPAAGGHDVIANKFTITGWDLKADDQDHHHLNEKIYFVIDEELALKKRAPSHDSSSVETFEPHLSSDNRVDEPVRGYKPGRQLMDDEDEIKLELTLGFRYASPVIVISDTDEA